MGSIGVGEGQGLIKKEIGSKRGRERGEGGGSGKYIASFANFYSGTYFLFAFLLWSKN